MSVSNIADGEYLEMVPAELVCIKLATCDHSMPFKADSINRIDVSNTQCYFRVKIET